MNGNHTGPIINSRHHGNLPRPNRGPFIIFGIIVLISIVGGFFFFITKAEKQAIDMEEDYYSIAEEEITLPFDSSQMGEIKDHIEENIITEEEGTAKFYYERALKKEKSKDFDGAVEDYTKAIELSSKNSKDMFNGLNGRGFVYAKEQKNYKAAMADFNQIIKIETSKSSPNNSRLEAGYTNRAYVKKMMGNKEGACNDLYEALYLGNEKSITFIEKQIEKNCY